MAVVVWLRDGDREHWIGAVPWAALPVGAKALCVLAAALWRLRRREGR
jgi:hypothetical protein